VKTRDKFVTSGGLFILTSFSVMLFISGCSGVGGDVQAGRSALQTGRRNDAVGYLTRAADADPNYKIPYQIRAGEVRQTSERAVSLEGDDPFVHLYLGIALLKTGARERGRNEVEDGLRAIDDTPSISQKTASTDSFEIPA
jgi:hypothetical protein